MKYQWGLIFRWSSLWVGVHWSSYNNRFCINLIPFLTLWIARPYGKVPHEGYDIVRRVNPTYEEQIENEYFKGFGND